MSGSATGSQEVGGFKSRRLHSHTQVTGISPSSASATNSHPRDIPVRFGRLPMCGGYRCPGLSRPSPPSPASLTVRFCSHWKLSVPTPGCLSRRTVERPRGMAPAGEGCRSQTGLRSRSPEVVPVPYWQHTQEAQPGPIVDRSHNPNRSCGRSLDSGSIPAL
jgi:hypothetical protein